MIYLVRHGENTANITLEFSCRSVDYSLTERGITQARRTAEYFRSHAVAAIFSSPLKRARETAEIIRGMPGSPGVAEGLVRVIHGGADFGALKPGEVLVAPYTNPSWTPLFRRAAAVVVDTGGPGSHAAIVAREYGIPAVMAAAEGTSSLRDGQPVVVDGTQGLVFRAAPRATEHARPRG